MKTAISIFSILLINFSFQNPVMAQLDRSINSDRVSNLGNLTANSDREASKKCRVKGGNIVFKNYDSYTCYYYQGLRR